MTNSNSTLQEISKLRNRDQGWHFGEGDPVSETAIELAKEFHAEVKHSGQTEVFPGMQGSLILAYYNPPVAVEVEIHPDSTYRVSREVGMGLDFDIDLYENGVSKERAKEVVEKNDSEIR